MREALHEVFDNTPHQPLLQEEARGDWLGKAEAYILAASRAAGTLGLAPGSSSASQPKPTWSDFIQAAGRLVAPVQEPFISQENHIDLAPADLQPLIQKLSTELAPDVSLHAPQKDSSKRSPLLANILEHDQGSTEEPPLDALQGSVPVGRSLSPSIGPHLNEAVSHPQTTS